ncbi:MAG: hypothetical protein HY364_04285 [Candidatus Aenigmarchaeota archaeon]|nr:hypothetical protein [Candidatus Aenigmarchaeota archaeon]
MRMPKWLIYAAGVPLIYAGSMLCNAAVDDYMRREENGIVHDEVTPFGECIKLTGMERLGNGGTFSLKEMDNGKPVDVARYRVRIVPDREPPVWLVQEYSRFSRLNMEKIGEGISLVAGVNRHGDKREYIITADHSGDKVVIGFAPLRCTDFSGY